MPTWLVSGGETGEFIRAFDWSSTSLGPLETWPQSLRTAANFMLEAQQPVYLGLGAESISLYNDAYIPILAGKHPAAIGKPYAVIWPEIWDEYRPHIEAVLTGKAQYWVDQPVMLVDRPDRPVSWFTFSWTPLRNEQGAVAGFFCVATETTERVLADRQLIESMDVGYCVIEVVFDDQARPIDYRFLKINPAFEQQTGLIDAQGKTARELVPHHEQLWVDTYAQVAFTGQPIRFINEAASMGRWYDVYAFRIAGQSNQVGVLFRDITERQQFEQHLQEADRRKDEFLAMLAHELRNPLAPIAAAADLLQIAQQEGARVRRIGGIISRQLRHMSGLVDDLLDVSRVTRGLVTLDKAPVDMRQIVTDAVEQVRPLIDTKRHQLILQVSPDAAIVVGDAKRLVQIVANLLNNAAKYTPDRGEVAIRLDVNGLHVTVEVADNGIGMPPDLVNRVFDLFAQAERSSDRTAGGLGIGLAIVKSLVELHGGVVSCESQGVGKGSRFVIRLPCLAECGEHTPMPTDDKNEREASRSLKILVVDDNKDAATMLAMLLETFGHQVLVEHNSRQALELTRKEALDLCLLDIGLPEMDGNELAERLRRQEETTKCKLVAVTGYGQESDRERTFTAGFDYHLVKPVDTVKLAAILAEVASE